jgi:hypothetical protein
MRVLAAALVFLGVAYVVDAHATHSKYTNVVVKMLTEIKRGFLG